jgi:hypothetical protein
MRGAMIRVRNVRPPQIVERILDDTGYTLIRLQGRQRERPQVALRVHIAKTLHAEPYCWSQAQIARLLKKSRANVHQYLANKGSIVEKVDG